MQKSYSTKEVLSERETKETLVHFSVLPQTCKCWTDGRRGDDIDKSGPDPIKIFSASIEATLKFDQSTRLKVVT